MRFTYTLLTARPCLRMNLCPTSPFCVWKHFPFRQRYHRTARRIKTKEQDPRKLEIKSSRLKRHQCCPCREVPSAASASGSNAGLAAGLAGDGFLSVVRNGYANAAARRHVSTCIQLYRQDHPRSKEKYLKICIVFQAILGLQLAPGQLRFFVAWPLRCEENVQSCAIHRIPLHWSVSLSSIVCIISSWISPYVPLRKKRVHVRSRVFVTTTTTTFFLQRHQDSICKAMPFSESRYQYLICAQLFTSWEDGGCTYSRAPGAWQGSVFDA